MSRLLSSEVYADRDDSMFLDEMKGLTGHHLRWCPEFAAMWPGAADEYSRLEDLPFVHAGLFKHLELRTENKDIIHGRVLRSSSTSGIASRIVLDEKSSALQSESTKIIFSNFVGGEKRPLLILDSAKSLLGRNDLNARTAAALSLRDIASDIVFLLEDSGDPGSVKWDKLAETLSKGDSFLVYGFSWILWFAWGAAELPGEIRKVLKDKTVSFVHSGGWKKLEEKKVRSEMFDAALLADAGAGSSVTDFYGLVEQAGVVFPRCGHGARHVPAWADVIVRDIFTMAPLDEEVGQLQLLNSITWGAPCHSVLTEDVGRILPGDCPCGRKGRRFELIGRVPKSEVRGCANV